MRNNGIWENKIPSYIKIIYCDELNNPKKYIKNLMCMNFFTGFSKAINYYEIIKAKSYWSENVLLSKFLPKINKEYDVAIAYHAPGTLPVHYAINNIIAKKKILFIHGDIEKTKCTEKIQSIIFKI